MGARRTRQASLIRFRRTDWQSVLPAEIDGLPIRPGCANGFWQMLRPRLCASRRRLRGRQRCGLCHDLLAHPRIEVHCGFTPVEHSHGTKTTMVETTFFQDVLEY